MRSERESGNIIRGLKVRSKFRSKENKESLTKRKNVRELCVKGRTSRRRKGIKISGILCLGGRERSRQGQED